jgi:hypothetical protein
MNLSDEIWLPANILFPDAPGSSTAELELRIRVPLPSDPTVARKVSLADLLADAELLDYYVNPSPPPRSRPAGITEPPFPGQDQP